MPKGVFPGEWVILKEEAFQKNFIAYVNLSSENFYKIKIVGEDREKKYKENFTEEFVARELIANNLKNALQRRSYFNKYVDGGRLVYGMADSLPGLIVDMYEKKILIQINTAGMDRFRQMIKEEIEKNFSEHKVIFFDNSEYRKAEMLPDYAVGSMEEDLNVSENGLKYIIPKSIIQKIGYYYDHRENRKKLMMLLSDLNIKKENGLDLFSYVGSWGLHLLKAGIGHVDFVDQGNMEEAIIGNLELNGFSKKGRFLRADVFKFLDEKIANGTMYDVVVSDPPAFTKSEKNKKQALLGYEKLHLKAMKILSDTAVMVIASCTHHVNHEELDKTVQAAALKNSRRVQLLDLGVQGFDHPFTGMNDKSFYIKYLVYFVSRG